MNVFVLMDFFYVRDPSPDTDVLGTEVQVVAFIKTTGQILIVDRYFDGGVQSPRIYSCPVDGHINAYSCEVWFREDLYNGHFLDPISIDVDEEKQLV